MMAASCREMVGGEEEVVVKERREEGIPGSALMMACSAGPHICAEKVSQPRVDGSDDTLRLI